MEQFSALLPAARVCPLTPNTPLHATLVPHCGCQVSYVRTTTDVAQIESVVKHSPLPDNKFVQGLTIRYHLEVVRQGQTRALTMAAESLWFQFS